MCEPAVGGGGLPASDSPGIVLGQFFESLLFLLRLLSGDDQRVRVSHHHLQRQQPPLASRTPPTSCGSFVHVYPGGLTGVLATHPL